MASALNAFMKIGKANGESKQEPFEDWIELQSWDWEVEAETSWTKGGGASVGKPSPGKMNWEHTWDRSSSVILGYICTGTAFEKIFLTMCKSTGKADREPFFKVEMREALHHQGEPERHRRRQRAAEGRDGLQVDRASSTSQQGIGS